MTIRTDRQNAGRSASARKLAPTPGEIEALATQSLEDDKAFDIVSVDLSGKTSIADYMLIASGTSARQVSAMADHLLETLKASGVKAVQVEGKSSGDWVLIDAGDVIIHLFRPEVRAFYNIEKMWMLDAPSSPGSNAQAMNAAHA